MGQLGDVDLHLFAEGTHARIYEHLGAHPTTRGGRPGVAFAVWAPNAARVAVIGDFEGWGTAPVPLALHEGSGIWEGFVPGLEKGAHYKYRIESRHDGYRVDKADPYAFRSELPPATASIVWDLGYAWGDGDWMGVRRAKNALDAPAAIYEVHLGSWMRVPEEENRWLSYREIAPKLAAHVRRCGFTHVELLPIAEHPFYPSWGYQVTGFFAPTARYGTPQDFMYLVDHLHREGIGVILDWTPAHFPTDEHGLIYFDGTHLYEHADPRMGMHAEWGSAIFNYGRNEVRSFLISNAIFWLDRYHIDGLRVDAVASMLYLDYGRRGGEWIANKYGRQREPGSDRLHPLVQRPASTASTPTSRPSPRNRPPGRASRARSTRAASGSGSSGTWAGCTTRWPTSPAIRSGGATTTTSSRSGACTSGARTTSCRCRTMRWCTASGRCCRRCTAISGSGSPTCACSTPRCGRSRGRSCCFRAARFGQYDEWAHDRSVDWHLLGDSPLHIQLMSLIMELNRLYKSVPALYVHDAGLPGFEWVDANDDDNSVYTFLRKGDSSHPEEIVLVVMNCTPVPHHDYRVGVPRGGLWREILNTDAAAFGGSGMGNLGTVMAEEHAFHARPVSLRLTLPPLSALYLAPAGASR